MKQTPADPAFNMEVLQAQIAALRDDLAQITATMASGLKTARDKVGGELADGVPAPADVEETLERTVRDHPFLALVMAGVIGFLLGSLTHRK